jgi:hypothetical protein
MQTLDPAGEWLRLSEHYRQLSDDELVGLARQTSDLTDDAQQALAQEIANRRLKIPPEESVAPSSPEPQPDSTEDGESPYAEDRELVVICTVWSLADALKSTALARHGRNPVFYRAGESYVRRSSDLEFRERPQRPNYAGRSALGAPGVAAIFSCGRTA